MAVSDNEKVKSKRELLVERMSKRYPEKDMSDDEVLSGSIYDDYDGYENELSGYKEREKAFSDLFVNDPRTASFVTDWRNGEDPVIGLVRLFGDELKNALDDPKLVDKLAEANKKYVERMGKEKELETEFQKNFPVSKQNFSDAVEQGVITEDEVDDVFERIRDIVTDGMVGVFRPETIALIAKSIHHDADVEDARGEGEVMGRNARIDERLRKSRRGDGTANLDGKNGGAPRPKGASSIFDLAASAR